MPEPFIWNQGQAQWEDEAGQPLSEEKVLAVADQYVAKKKAQADQLMEDLFEDRIDLNTWRDRARELGKDSHISQYLLGKGGRDRMTFRDYGIIGRRLQTVYDRITAFAVDFADGRYTTENLPSIKARGQLIIDGSSLMYSRATLEVHRGTMQFLQWVVGPTEHCDDCLRLNGQVHTADEWLASGWLPRAWRLACKGLKCQCHLRKTQADGPEGGF